MELAGLLDVPFFQPLTDRRSGQYHRFRRMFPQDPVVRCQQVDSPHGDRVEVLAATLTKTPQVRGVMKV